MIELIRTNDAVLLSFAESLMKEAGIHCLIADQGMSILEGSLGMLPRRFLLLADNPLTLAQLRAEIEDLGEETRCQTALTAEEALFRLSQESVDAVLLLPCPAADCLTQSLLRHPPLAPPFLLGGLDGELPEISQLPAWFSVLRLPALAAAHLPECTELARQLLTALVDKLTALGVKLHWDSPREISDFRPGEAGEQGG